MSKRHFFHDVEITSDIANELLSYNPDTGELFWKERDIKWAKPDGWNGAQKAINIWNSKFSGKPAFTFKSKSHGYLEGAILGKGLLAHRVIWLMMTGEWPNVIDHKNGDRTDNRWGNLRSVTTTVNSQNQTCRSDNATGIRGVTYKKDRKKFYAAIKVNKQHIHLGCFKTVEEAKAARLAAEIKYGFYIRDESTDQRRKN